MAKVITLKPSAIQAISNFTPNNVAYLQDSPSSPDENNLVTITGASSNVDLSFNTIGELAGTQTVNLVYTDNNWVGLHIEVIENGAIKHTSAVVYTGYNNLISSFSFNSDILDDSTGKNMLIRIVGHTYNGLSINSLNSVELVASYNLTDDELIDSLKKDWTTEDFYNYEDLDRVESAIELINKKVFEFRGQLATIDNQTLLISPVKANHVQPWYGNLSFSNMTFPSGASGFRAEMTNFEANPRMRIVSTTSNVAMIEKGKTYKFTVIFNHSIKLVKAELLGLYYYKDVSATFWQTFGSVNIDTMELVNEIDGTRKYSQTFVAQETAGVRPSFGFGLGNPDMANGVWCNIQEFRIDEVRTEKSVEFADDLNRIENNILILSQSLDNRVDIEKPKTNWTYNFPFDFNDANRLERNLFAMYHYIKGNQANIPYTGQYITGQEGVI